MTAHIMIVEDNAINLKLARYVLERAGFSVTGAASAEEAQALLRHAVPDLILVDIGLPGMDGLTFTRELKSASRYQSIPIVAFSAFAMKGDERKAVDSGCDGYITKPIDTRLFPDQVAAFLRARDGN